MILVVPRHPLTFMDNSKLLRSKVCISRPRLPFCLFYLSMNNPRVANKFCYLLILQCIKTGWCNSEGGEFS